MNDKFILISLIAFLTNTASKKNINVTPLDVLNKILKDKLDGYNYNSLEALAAMVTYFMSGTKDFNTCGLSSTNEIIKEITRMLSEHYYNVDDLPF